MNMGNIVRFLGEVHVGDRVTLNLTNDGPFFNSESTTGYISQIGCTFVRLIDQPVGRIIGDFEPGLFDSNKYFYGDIKSWRK